jgi:hypothetical protein
MKETPVAAYVIYQADVLVGRLSARLDGSRA